MISPHGARRYVDRTGADCGQDVILPDDIDTSKCQEFFGMRCSDNVHVKGSRTAHVDRVDPRRNPIGHLKSDVGVPYAVMAGLGFAAIGAAMSRGDWKRGAAIGGVAGLFAGAVADAVDHYKNSNNGGMYDGRHRF